MDFNNITIVTLILIIVRRSFFITYNSWVIALLYFTSRNAYTKTYDDGSVQCRRIILQNLCQFLS